MNPITLDAIKLLIDCQNTNDQVSTEDKELAKKMISKLLRFMDGDIDAVIEKTSKFLK